MNDLKNYREKELSLYIISSVLIFLISHRFIKAQKRNKILEYVPFVVFALIVLNISLRGENDIESDNKTAAIPQWNRRKQVP